jgi:hypothetical protein
MPHHRPTVALLLLSALLAFAPAARAQTEGSLLQINQTGIGSNGFGTTWRGQDVELAEDAWLTRIVFETGSATPNIDEIRLMTAVPGPLTLRTVTSFTTTPVQVTAVLPEPFLLDGGRRYTVWFHQNGSPLGTYGCNLRLVDPTWGGYHTNVDPTVAPGPGEPGYYWFYQYGTNMQLIGYDNFEITGSLVPGGVAQLLLQAPPLAVSFTLFGLLPGNLPVLNFRGELRLDPQTVSTNTLTGIVDPSGNWGALLTIPNNNNLRGLSVFLQAVYDPTFTVTATFSPMEELRIQ